MPMYSYTCCVCDNKLEVMMTIANRDQPKHCDLCNTDGSLRRDMGNGGFTLKGSGWAKDGYASYLGDIPK